jgi:hypothetical protein
MQSALSAIHGATTEQPQLCLDAINAIHCPGFTFKKQWGLSKYNSFRLGLLEFLYSFVVFSKR